MRISKYMAACGVCSRRKAEDAIIAGRVRLNGDVVAHPGAKLALGDIVELDGRVVHQAAGHVYIMLHKPEGYITTTAEQFGRPSVMNLIRNEGVRLVPVGRLDYNTSGLLLLTNDGDFVQRLTHPRYSISKTYHVRIRGCPSSATLAQLQSGVVIDGYQTRPSKIRLLRFSPEGFYSIAEVVLREGRNRQVRKMFGQAGHDVLSLRRVSMGSLGLGSLKKGEYRHLTAREVEYLMA